MVRVLAIVVIALLNVVSAMESADYSVLHENGEF